MLSIILSFIISLILFNNKGYFFAKSFIEKDKIVTRLESSIEIAVAILLLVSQNNAISQSNSSAITFHKITSFQLIFFLISKVQLLSIYIAFASSPSLKRISHFFNDFSWQNKLRLSLSFSLKSESSFIQCKIFIK